MKIRITDSWPSGLNVDPDVVDVVFDRNRIAAALAEVEAVEVITLPPGFNPRATGRGPRRWKRWYEIKTTDGATIRGRWVGVDATDPDRAEHWLTFEDDEFVHEIPYGEIVSCLPMNAQLRAREVEAMAARDARRRTRRRERRTR